MKKILLVGGSGYLGQEIAKKLSKHFEIIIFGKPNKTNFKTIVFDVLDSNRFNVEFKKYKFEAVIHLLGSKNISHAQEDEDYSFKLNINSLKNSINSCEKNSTKIVFISSAAVYGKQKIPHSEELLPSPINLYGELKYLAEKTLIKEAMEKKIPYTILRVFSVYSKNDKRLFIGKLFESLKTKTILTIFNPYQIRDFIHIDDLSEIIIKTIELKETDNQIINAGSGFGITIQKIINLFKENRKMVFKEEQGNQGYNSLADTTKLKEIYGIFPRSILPELTKRLKNGN